MASDNGSTDKSGSSVEMLERNDKIDPDYTHPEYDVQVLCDDVVSVMTIDELRTFAIDLAEKLGWNQVLLYRIIDGSIINIVPTLTIVLPKKHPTDPLGALPDNPTPPREGSVFLYKKGGLTGSLSTIHVTKPSPAHIRRYCISVPFRHLR